MFGFQGLGLLDLGCRDGQSSDRRRVKEHRTGFRAQRDFRVQKGSVALGGVWSHGA